MIAKLRDIIFELKYGFSRLSDFILKRYINGYFKTIQNGNVTSRMDKRDLIFLHLFAKQRCKFLFQRRFYKKIVMISFF